MLRILPNIVLLLSLSAQAQADWTLDNEASVLNFVSTKALDIAEVHRFTDLAGRIAPNGKAAVSIVLASVDTRIPIRDERMREMLFESGDYPEAIIRTRIDKKVLDDLQPGSVERLDLELELDLHGVRLPLTANVTVSRLSESTLTVSSTQPLIVNAASFNLSDGIEKLRKIANLPSIGKAVPVTFALTYVMQP